MADDDQLQNNLEDDQASQPVVDPVTQDAVPAPVEIPATTVLPTESEQPQEPSNFLKTLLEKCKQVIAGRKQKKLEKILQLANQKKKITNAEVCSLLHVS